MLFYNVIPFLLGCVIEKETAVSPRYKFQVRIDTLFKNTTTDVNWEGNAGLTFDMKCRPQSRNKLRCHVLKNRIFYSPSIDPFHITENNVFTPSDLDFENIHFITTFNSKGAQNYSILTPVVNASILLELYKAIGEQLSIGTDIKTKGSTKESTTNYYIFKVTDEFNLQKCPTFYRISTKDSFVTTNFTLRSLINNSNFTFKPFEKFLVKIDREMKGCDWERGNMIGKRLWSDLILAPTYITMKTRSEMLMTLGMHEFNSKSTNTYRLYYQKRTLGIVHETISISLISILLNKKKTS